MFTTEKKLLIMIELTVPWESRIDEAYERNWNIVTNVKAVRRKDGLSGATLSKWVSWVRRNINESSPKTNRLYRERKKESGEWNKWASGKGF